ncbi:putative ribonuclease H-like domain-containing protein [Tanacetum coccineum]
MRYGLMKDGVLDYRMLIINLWRIVQHREQPKEVGKRCQIGRNTFVHLLLIPEGSYAVSSFDDARDIWMAVKARFGGNEESKKMKKTMLKQQFAEFSVTEEEGLHKGYDRFQKILSQLNQVQARPDNDDINLKFLRALPSSCYGVKVAADPSHYVVIGTASFGSKLSYSDQQRIVPSVSQTPGRSDNVMECVLHSFVAENEQDQDMIYEDFDQVDQLEMEEMDLKWQMAMLSLRINRFGEKRSKDELTTIRSLPDLTEEKLMLHIRSSIGTILLDHAERKHDTGAVEKAYQHAVKTLESQKDWISRVLWRDEVFDLSTPSVFYSDPVEKEVKPLYSTFVKAGEMHTVPPPITGTYMPSPYQSDIEETQDSPASVFFFLFMLVDLILLLVETDQQSFCLVLLLVHNNVVGLKDQATVCCWVDRDDGILLLRPQQVTLGGIKDHSFGDPRVMVDLINPHGDIGTDNDIGGIVDSGCSRSMTGNKEKLALILLPIKGGHCYTRFKTDTPAGTHETNNNTGPSSNYGPSIMERNTDYAEELAKLQRQEYEAKDAAARYGYLFSQATAEILCQAEAEIRNQGVSAVTDPAGIDSAVREPAGIVSADGVETYDESIQGNPAVSTSVSADFSPVHANESTLPPGQSLGSSENTKRFPVPSDVCKDQISSGIFTSSSYDDDFRATLTNLAPAVEVNPVPTKRVNTIHPQSQILGDLASPVLTRSRAQKSKFGESAFIGYIQDQQRTNHTDQLHCLFACFLSQLEPTSIAKALEDPDWVDAMQEEMQQFINQQVWKLVPLPDGKHAIGTKWILKNKRDARGIVVRNKARLVAQGHRQEEGIDYDEVFAPVARIEAIRLFLAFASYMGFLVYQLDVKSAFLYGEIEEEVYVTQPKGFEDPYFPKHVYRVVKALYGLHQAPRAWYARLSAFLLQHNYRRGTIDKTLFIKKDSRDILLVQVYVDDIIFGSTNKAWCDEFEVLMKGEFEMSAMGEMTFFLGLQVKQLPDGIFISQDKYVKDMLTKFDMESVRTATTPYEAAKTKLKDETDPPVNVHLYRSMIGSLMYLTASRPDIMFAVSACSRHQVTPLTSHLNAVKKIFKYLKGQPKLGLWYPKDSPFQLEAYSDSDYAGSHGDRKSTTGGCQFLGRRLISWQCKKQTIVATSSTEAEYVAAASCCAQVLWIQNQLLDYGFNFMNTKIFIDNQSTICIVKNPVFHQRTKHIEIRHHFIRDANEKNLIQVVNTAASSMDYADGSVFMLVGILLLVDSFLLLGCVFLLYAWFLLVFLLADLFVAGSNLCLLSQLRFCCAQLDIAGWLVSATSHLVSAGSIQSCWWNIYKNDHNKIAYLGRESGSEDFTDILSYLDHSTLRAQLQLDDANGIFDMQIDDILEGMGVIGYPTPDRTLTFLKHHLSPQWRFLVHTILHCLSPKAGSWNQFPSSIATALVCLSTGRVYNFSRFILEGMIANVKTKKNKFLMYPRFLQMLVAIETADRTPRPTSAFTRKLFSNMRLKWAGEEIPLTPPMLAIAAAGDAADEENAAAHEAAGSTAEAHPAPHSPPFSPVRESTPERQPETEWVVPNPVSPGTDWRPWPSVPAPRPPTPPAQTLSFEEPLVFGPVPKPAGYVDPDTIDPIIFGPPPRPYDFVDPALEEPVIFGPLPRPANYIAPEDRDNLNSMEDDTILGGFHEETHAGPDDAPTPTADAAGRAEDPALLTSLSAKIDRCMGRIDSLETELGTSKKIMGGAILTLVSRVKKLERTVKQLRSARLVGDAPATEGDVDIQDEVDLEGLSRMASDALGHDQATVPSEDIEEREEEEVPLRRKRSVHRRARTEFNTSAFAQFPATLSADVLSQAAVSASAGPSGVAVEGKAPMPDLDIPAEFLAEDTQARQASKKNRQLYFIHKCAWCAAHNGTITMKAVTAMSKQQLTEEYENICRRLEKDHLLSAQYNLFRPKPALTEPPSKRQRAWNVLSSQPSDVPAATTQLGYTGSLTGTASYCFHFRSNGFLASPSKVFNAFFLDSDEDEQIGLSRVAAEPDSDDEVLAEILFRGHYVSGAGVVVVDKLPDDEIVDPRVKVEPISESASSPPRSRSKHRGVRSDTSLWDRPVDDFLSSESESDDDIEDYIPPIPYGAFKDWEIVRCPLRNTYYHVYYQENRRHKNFFYLKELLPHVYREDLLLLRRRMNRYFRLNPDVDVGLDLWRDVNLLCQSLHSDDVEDFWRTQDEWVVSGWRLYPKSSVHVLDLTHGKTVYMFVDKVYPIRAPLLERMLHHRLTVPPSYCRDVVVAGSVIQTIQDGLRESYECLASAPIVDMVINPPWNLPFLGAKGLTSPEQTATGKVSAEVVVLLLVTLYTAAAYFVPAALQSSCAQERSI